MTDAEAAGQTTGQLLVVVLLLWGVIKCGLICRRPTTNTKCVVALMLLLIAWTCGALLAAFFPKGEGFQVIYALLGLTMIGLVVGAIIMAILGLVEYGQGKGQYVQGKKQAIWALILCGLFLAAALAGFVRGRPRMAGLPNQPSAGKALVFGDLNFKFTAPGRPWSQIDASKINQAAKLCFIQGTPDIYFMVSADPIGYSDMTTEGFVEFSSQRMKTMADSVQVRERSPLRIGGLLGERVEMETQMRGYNFYYLHWFCVTNGWAYQLMTWGRVPDRQKVVSEGGRLMQNFALLDYERRPPLAGHAMTADFVSTNFGYRVRGGNSEWMAWETLDKENEQASFGLQHPRGAVLAVTAVSLMDLRPRSETVYRALVENMGLGEASKIISRSDRIHQAGMDGIEAALDTTLKDGKLYSCRVKVLHGQGFAYAAVTWIDASQTGKEQLLTNAISLVDLSQRPDSIPDAKDWDERTKRVHRIAFNSIGMQSYREGGFLEAARYFERATAWGGPPGATPYLGNLVEALISAGRHGEALAGLEKYPEIVRAQLALQAQRAFLQGKLAQPVAAISNYATLFSGGYSSEDHFREYIGMLAQNNQSDKALTEVELYLKKQDTPGIRLLQSGLLKQQKKFIEAVAILKAQRELNHFHAGIAYALGDAYIQAGQPTEALALSQEMIAQQGASVAMTYLKGRAEFALKWYREAKDSFERAQKESPSDPDIKGFLDAVSAMLGEGSSALVRDTIAPVALPTEFAALPESPPTGYGREEGAYYQRVARAVSFVRGKELKTTDYLSIKTLNPAGVSAFSTFQIGFNPLAEELCVNRFEVRDATGSLVSTGRVSDSYVLDDRTSTEAVSRKVLNLPVSGLRPDCTVELTLTRRELGNAKEFTFLPNIFSKAMPVQESILCFRGDTGAVRYASSPKIEPQRVDSSLCWVLKNPPAVRWEPLLPSVTDYVPIIWLGDSTMTWTNLVTNYLASIRDRLELPKSHEAMARSLTAGATNVMQKIAAIADYVQTNYSYKAIEFGRRARVPQALEDIIRNRYGDCKDHSVLAQQMLKAAGVDSSLALVSVSAPVRPDLPSLDQFDHVVVYIPTPSGNKFLDCTAKNSNLADLWTVGLAGRDSLVLDEVNPRFVRIPNYPTNASTIRVMRSVELTNQTDAFVQEEIRFQGLHASYMREGLRQLPAEGRRSYFANQIIGSAGRLVELAFEGLEQPQSPLTVKMTYLTHGQFHLVERQIAGTPPALFEYAFLVQESQKRISPFEIVTPLTVEGTVVVNIPSQFKPKAVAESSTNIGNSFVNCRTSTKLIENGWQLNYQFYEPAGRRSALEYGDHCRATQQVLDMLRPRFIGELVRR